MMSDAELMQRAWETHGSEMRAEEKLETATNWAITAGIAALCLTFTLGFLLQANEVHWFPETGVGVLCGAICSGGAILLGQRQVVEEMHFDYQFFVIWLLPPIIFEAAFNLNVDAFLESIVPTLLFAFVGLLLSSATVALLMYTAGQLGLCYPLGTLSSLTFGALISATDPVSVLATFQSLGVHVPIFSMVFGESVLNDAAAMVLTTTLLHFTATPFTPAALLPAAGAFFGSFSASAAIGAGAGLASALLFKHLEVRHYGEVYVEVALSFTFPWAAFFLAEALQVSGVVAILFCGIAMAIYTRNSLSDEAAELMAGAYKVVGKVAESFVFVYIGMALPTLRYTPTVFRLGAVAVVACLFGRWHVFALSALTNAAGNRTRLTTPPRIEPPHMLVMWLAGLRGGVAFAIASASLRRLDFPAQCGGLPRGEAGYSVCRQYADVKNDSDAILHATVAVTLVTLFACGGAMPYLVRACGVVDLIEPPPEMQSHPLRRGPLSQPLLAPPPALKSAKPAPLPVAWHSKGAADGTCLQPGGEGHCGDLAVEPPAVEGSSAAQVVVPAGGGGGGGGRPARFGQAASWSAGGMAHPRHPSVLRTSLSRELGVPTHAPPSARRDFALSDVLTKHGRERDDPCELRFEPATLRRGPSAGRSSASSRASQQHAHAAGGSPSSGRHGSHGEGGAGWAEAGRRPSSHGRRSARDSGGSAGSVAPGLRHLTTIPSISSWWSHRQPSFASPASPYPHGMGMSASEALADVSSSSSSGGEP